MPAERVLERNAMNKKILGGAMGAAMALSIGIVSTWEGTELESYQDSVGVWTVCTGHTGTAAPGQTRTPAECEALLASDLGDAFAAVDRYIHVPLEPETRAAFVSFTFNLGAGKLQRSTLARKANAGDLEGACNELPRWVYAGGQRLRGLVNRRKAERDLCLEGVRNAEQADSKSDAVGAGDSASGWGWFDMATQWFTGSVDRGTAGQRQYASHA